MQETKDLPKKIPHVVYHIAAMGNWEQVVSEQFLSLRVSGLAQALAGLGDYVRVTFVGNLGLTHLIQEEAARQDVPVKIVRQDINILHYETFAMLEIERLAKKENTDRPILYMHTKGVSVHQDIEREMWRKVMHRYVVDDWKKNCDVLAKGEHDAAGWNWWAHGNQHFSGTFWIANPDLLRRLPLFVEFHHKHKLVRYSCELWIGSSGDCRAYSLGTSEKVTWNCGYDYGQHLDLKDKITWISGATHSYANQLAALTTSFQRIGAGHQLRTMLIPNAKWRHCQKLDIIKTILPTVSTPYVFWIDADCEFLCALHHTDFISDRHAISCVQHLSIDSPFTASMPEGMLNGVAREAKGYWQACLFGGTVKGVSQLLERVSWIHDDPRGYDEHALNIDFQSYPIHTLPCRYACPTTFEKMPQHQNTYTQRAGGPSRIAHKNSEINR